jgi:hypothetical protein
MHCGREAARPAFAGTAANGRLRAPPKAPMLNRRGTPSAGGSCMPRRRCCRLTFVALGAPRR